MITAILTGLVVGGFVALSLWILTGRPPDHELVCGVTFRDTVNVVRYPDGGGFKRDTITATAKWPGNTAEYERVESTWYNTKTGFPATRDMAAVLTSYLEAQAYKKSKTEPR